MAVRNRTHQVAAPSEGITAICVESSFAECGAEAETSADVTLLQGSQPGHHWLQLVVALLYHPRTCAKYPALLTHPGQPAQITGADTLERCNLKHSELNAQPLDLKSES